MVIAIRLAAAGTAGLVSGLIAICMIFAPQAPNNHDLGCPQPRCIAPGFQA
jgi:hypothetical protein